mgnify:CR=1 FL=1
MINCKDFVEFMSNVRREGIDITGITLIDLVGAFKAYKAIKGCMM